MSCNPPVNPSALSCNKDFVSLIFPLIGLTNLLLPDIFLGLNFSGLQFAPNPPTLSCNPPALSFNPPVNPSALSFNPPVNPPALSFNPPTLSCNPPALSFNPPTLSCNPLALLLIFDILDFFNALEGFKFFGTLLGNLTFGLSTVGVLNRTPIDDIEGGPGNSPIGSLNELIIYKYSIIKLKLNLYWSFSTISTFKITNNPLTCNRINF